MIILLLLQEVIECFIARAPNLNNTEIVPYCFPLAVYSAPSIMHLINDSITVSAIIVTLFVSAEMYLKSIVLLPKWNSKIGQRLFWINLSSLIIGPTVKCYSYFTFRCGEDPFVEGNVLIVVAVIVVTTAVVFYCSC